jgi:hypothetical protein
MKVLIRLLPRGLVPIPVYHSPRPLARAQPGERTVGPVRPGDRTPDGRCNVRRSGAPRLFK